MYLEQAGTQFNRLRPEMRQALEEKILSFGKQVRYKFNIVKDNPDPTKHNGDKLYPNVYTLDPCVIDWTDKDEKRTGESRGKKLALVIDTNEKGDPTRFKKVQVFARDKGILTINLETDEGVQTAMYMELHPKHNGGDYADKTKNQVFSRIDEIANAKNARTERTARVKALNAAQSMSDTDLVTFADAMQWDSTEELEVLRNKAEELADTDPVFFNDLVEGKAIEYKALVKQAMDRNLIGYDPAEFKVFWVSNNTVITITSPANSKSEVDQIAEYLQVGGAKADEVYKKIKSLLKAKA